jgi:hyperosmotically inducible periplasmic protein
MEVYMLRRFEGMHFRIPLSILILGLSQAGMASVPKAAPQSLASRVQHQLLMLPYYGVFDELAFSLEGNTVVLTGDVTGPTLRSDAEAVVRKVEGVTKVVNNIEVLPLSAMDNSLRLAAYRAIFSIPGFEKYADQGTSPIRIIVKNGDIRLEGIVLTEFDRIMAGMAARGVPFSFSLTNNLKVG